MGLDYCLFVIVCCVVADCGRVGYADLVNCSLRLCSGDGVLVWCWLLRWVCIVLWVVGDFGLGVLFVALWFVILLTWV